MIWFILAAAALAWCGALAASDRPRTPLGLAAVVVVLGGFVAVAAASL